jgi:tRNA(Arg) A34 adenosine deaminase TadA
MRQTACAALVADGSDAGLGGELVSAREAVADHAEFGEDLSDADPRQPSGKDMTLLLSRRSVIMCSMRLVILAISVTRIWTGRASVRTSSPLDSASASLAHPSGPRRRRSTRALGDRSASVAMLGEEAGQAFGPGALGGFQAWD